MMDSDLEFEMVVVLDRSSYELTMFQLRIMK